MNRRLFLQQSGAFAAASLLSRGAFAEQGTDISQRARTLFTESLILDMTAANSPIHSLVGQPVGFDPWIAKYRDAGVTWLSMTVSSDHTRTTGEMIHLLGANRRYLLERPDEYVFVESVADVARAKAENRLAVNFNFQGSQPLEGDINLIEPLKRLGVGHMLLAYNDMNLAAGGSHDDDDPGLSFYGRALVREMNRVGMVVDCTHTSHRSTLQICETSTKPVIFSHSSAQRIRNHERNIADDQIAACAATGGVIGVNGVGLYLSDTVDDISAEAMFAHVDYIADLVGAEHVGIGLDYVPGQDGPAPEGVNVTAALATRYGEDQYPPMNRVAVAGPSVLLPLTQLMLDHGYAETAIRGILGGNFLRVFEEAWG